MSSTIKARLALVKTNLDSLFAGANAAERAVIIKDLRDHLSRVNSAAREPGYDKHSNSATR